MTTADELIEKIAEKLKCPRAKLSSIPTDVLIRMMTDDALTAAQQAGVFVVLGSSDPLREHFSEQEKRQRDQWRVSEQKHSADREATKHLSWPSLQKSFVDMAKNQLLTEEEAVLGTYLMFGDEDARKFFSCTIMRKRNFERVQAHNFYVASRMEDPDCFLASHGSKLLSLQYPLFPPTNEFTSLNTKLLFEVVEGGGTPSSIKATLPRLFRYDTVAGGGFAPIGQLQDGSWAADVTRLEDKNKELEAANRSLKSQIQGLERKFHRQGSDQNPPAYARNENPQPWRGRGRGGRGARGGDYTVPEVVQQPHSHPRTATDTTRPVFPLVQ